MEADITPLAETNGEQRENPQESATNENPEQQERPDLAKSLDAAEDGVSGAVGQIIDYLEDDAGTANADQDAEMGEAEYLDGEMPAEDETEGQKANESGQEASNKADLEGTAAEDEVSKEKTEGEGEKGTEHEKEAAPLDQDPVGEGKAAQKDGEDVDPEGEDAAEKTGEGEGAIEGEDGDEDEEEEEDPTEETEEVDQEFENASDAEGELITGDEPGETADGVAPVRERKKEEPVDENQCRVCTSKEELVCLFKKQIDATPADMLLVICPSVSILPKDFMPQFICTKCMGSLTIAIQLRKQLETTDQDLRKRLSRSKNKVRRPRGYVVIDAPVTDSSEDEDEQDDEFKVSDVGGTTSADSDSVDSDASEKKEKKKPGPRGRPRKKPLKRGTDSEEEPSSAPKKKYQPTSVASVGPFECPKCDLTFSRKQSYVLHRKTHERIEHACPICGKKFKVEWAYKTHMQRHEQERAHFRCELCPKIFRLRAELKHHMAQRHDEHGFIYECKRCQRTFLTQQRLQRHQATGCQRHKEETVRIKEEQPRIKQEPRIKEERIGHGHGHSQGNNMGKRRPGEGRDLFKAVAPPTTTYWSDSFSD
ncbi:hypothetical protein KR084_009336 [Drosophila pseudotakahashii]|nr:hypothetical protein KR084_009336 [Drosophila pseudotakahashii]